MNSSVVLAGQDEHLVRPAGLSLDVNGATMVHCERLIAVERRIQIWNHPHAPRATFVDSFEGRQCDLFVARAKRARPIGIGFDLDDSWCEIGRTLSTLGHDCHPPPGEGIKTQLTHSTSQLRTFDSSDGRDCDCAIDRHVTWTVGVEVRTFRVFHR